MDDAEMREIKAIAEIGVNWLKELGVDLSTATEEHVILATAFAYIVDDDVDPALLTTEEIREYLDRARYNHELAQKWLHAEKFTPH